MKTRGFRGWNLDLAMKVPQSAVFQTKAGKENFMHEAETCVNLGLHPHVVSCYYVRPVDDVPLVFAEYVNGGSLSEWIRSGKIYEGGPKSRINAWSENSRTPAFTMFWIGAPLA